MKKSHLWIMGDVRTRVQDYEVLVQERSRVFCLVVVDTDMIPLLFSIAVCIGLSTLMSSKASLGNECVRTLLAPRFRMEKWRSLSGLVFVFLQA